MGHQRVLDIALTKNGGLPDLNQISEVSNPISEAIDESNLFDFEYILDIGTPGAERELSFDELEDVLHSYVFVKFKNPTAGADSVYGDLVSLNDDSIVIEYRVKHTKKTIELKKENIARINLAIKM